MIAVPFVYLVRDLEYIVVLLFWKFPNCSFLSNKSYYVVRKECSDFQTLGGIRLSFSFSLIHSGMLAVHFGFNRIDLTI